MAFYQNVPGKRPAKRNYGNEGSWADEGAEYRNHSHGDRPQRSASSRPSGSGQRDQRDFSPRSSRFSDSPRNGSFQRQDRTPSSNVGAAPRSYRDFQYQAARSRPAPILPVQEQEDTSAFILAGRNPIREALKAGRDLEKLYVQHGELSGSAREIVQMVRERHIPVQETEKARLDEMAPHHQGLVAVASAYQYATVEDMLSLAAQRQEAPFLVLLDGITDPHNLGAIIRSAECAGAHGVILPERRSVGLTPAAVKASAGSIEYLKVARVANLNRTIQELQKQQIWTYAMTMDGRDYEQVDFDGGVALVIGAEGEGISRLTREICDTCVSLPLKGEMESLNASVAAGIMMYRILSTRRKP